MPTCELLCKYRVTQEALEAAQKRGQGVRVGSVTILATAGQPEDTCLSPFMINFPVCSGDNLQLTNKTCEWSPEFTGTRSEKVREYIVAHFGPQPPQVG